MENNVLNEHNLNPKQEEFCQLYTTDKEFFGNGVESYLEIYDIDRSKPNWYKSACSCASKLLSNAKVIDRISDLLEEGGLNDNFVDKQLKFLLTQKADFGNKMRAIAEYNKLKARITEKKELSGNVTITKILDELDGQSEGISETQKVAGGQGDETKVPVLDSRQEREESSTSS